MKIGLLVQRFPGGGAEKYVEEIAARLSKEKIDVTVITSQNDHDDSKYDFKIIRLPSFFKIGEYNIWRGLEKILRQEKFDVIHTNTYGYYHSDKAARLKKKLGYKLVMTSHGFTGMDLHKLKKQKIISQSSPFDFLREIYDDKIGKKTLLLCDHLIALSQYDYDFYKEIGVDESKISIIPPGVSDVFFEDATKIDLKGDPILLSVGQLSWIKNQKMMINAMPELIKQKPNAHLYLIGPDGGEQSNLKRLCHELKIDNHVSFLGTKTPKEIRDYMKSSDLLLQTSYAEGLSTVLLESASLGLPFVTTPAGGNQHLCELGFGSLISFDDTLTQKTMQIIDEKDKFESMNNRNVNSHYSWSIIFPKIFESYKNLV
ncbi:MAG: glycosyltransferase family 4 protein [Nitrosarchaeum sp.]|nr:glycosyltransferase family 4 protein [Nitrosarchaeum sp.]